MPTSFPVKLMLDSGAYSAWRQRFVIDLDEYIALIQNNLDCLDSYVNLDVIPGVFGRKPTSVEVEDSAKQGFSNLKKMEKHGLSPIPVFHQGERWYWLKRLIDEGYTYIGISPANDRSTDDKRHWLDEAFGFIPPFIKTHAFGMTQVELLHRYPWYSCDSMTWMITAANGGVLFPIIRWPKLLLKYQPKVIKVTDGTRGDTDHYDNQPRAVQFLCSRFWAWTTPFNLEQLKCDYVNRTAANVLVCRSIENRLIRYHKGHFGKLIYAVNDSPAYSAALSGILIRDDDLWSRSNRQQPNAPDDYWYDEWDGEVNKGFYGMPYSFFQPNRLLSFWILKEAGKDKDPEFLRRYVSTGLIDVIELRDKLGDPFEPQFDPRRR